MPNIYRCEFLGDDWGPWEGGHDMPPLPYDFVAEECTISISSRKQIEWCYAYDPSAELITWCHWAEGFWSDWHKITELPASPNWDVDGIDTFFSVGTLAGETVLYSYNSVDGSLYFSPWSGRFFDSWQGEIFLEAPPNLSEATDIFTAGDEDNSWMLSVDLEEWSIFYTQWDEEAEAFTAWEEAPDLDLPEEWLEMGIDIDGDSRRGIFWLSAAVYEEEDFN